MTKKNLEGKENFGKIKERNLVERSYVRVDF
jgi:hypothetical protein